MNMGYPVPPHETYQRPQGIQGYMPHMNINSYDQRNGLNMMDMNQNYFQPHQMLYSNQHPLYNSRDVRTNLNMPLQQVQQGQTNINRGGYQDNHNQDHSRDLNAYRSNLSIGSASNKQYNSANVANNQLEANLHNVNSFNNTFNNSNGQVSNPNYQNQYKAVGGGSRSKDGNQTKGLPVKIEDSRLAKDRGAQQQTLIVNHENLTDDNSEYQPFSAGAVHRRINPKTDNSPLNSLLNKSSKFQIQGQHFETKKVNHYSMNSKYRPVIDDNNSALLGDLHRYVPRHLQDKDGYEDHRSQTAKSSVQQNSECLDNRLEIDMFNLLDYDESNNYNPSRYMAYQEQHSSYSGYEGSYGSYQNQMSQANINTISNANLNSSGTNNKSEKASTLLSIHSGSNMQEGIKLSNTDFSDDNTLEQIFLEGNDNIFKISDKKSLTAESFKGSFTELYRGGGGSTHTGHKEDDNYSQYRLGGSMGEFKRGSMGEINSKRENYNRTNAQPVGVTYKSTDKKYQQQNTSVLSDGKKDYSLDDYGDDIDQIDNLEHGREFNQYQFQNYEGADWLRRSLGAQRNFYEAGEDDLD